MGNWVLSIIILGAFFGFLLIASHLGIRQLIKGYKLNKLNKQYDGIRSRDQSKPIYIQRNKIDTFYDTDPVQEWQDLGVIPIAKARNNTQGLKDHS